PPRRRRASRRRHRNQFATGRGDRHRTHGPAARNRGYGRAEPQGGRTESHSGQPERFPARVHGRNASPRPARSEVRGPPRRQPGGHAGRAGAPALRAERAFGPIVERTDEGSTRPAQAGRRTAEVIVNKSASPSWAILFACPSLTRIHSHAESRSNDSL